MNYTPWSQVRPIRVPLFRSLADSRSQKELQKHTHTVHMKKPLPVRLCGLKTPYLVKPSTLVISLYCNLYSALSNILIADKKSFN